MKFVRFVCKQDRQVRTGLWEQNELAVIEGDLFGNWKATGERHSISDVTLLSPLVPRHIIGVGKNFVAEDEAKPNPLPDLPVFFFKPLSTVIGTEEQIVLPKSTNEVKFESELAAVIGKKARNVSEADALSYVFGYTVANDVTAPQFTHADGHWTINKSFDTFTPLGPCIETELDLDSVRVKAQLNGLLKQDSKLDLMILSIPFLISYLSGVMTLEPGDVILTGSPAGAVFMKDGDQIVCSVHGIGAITNRVVSSN